MDVSLSIVERNRLRINPGAAALLGAMTIWGGSYVVAHLVLDSVGPFVLLFGRFLLAFAVLFPIARRAGFRMRMMFRRSFLIFGLTGFVLHLTFETTGLMFTTPGSAAIVIATAPAVTLLVSVLFLNERLTPQRSLGIALSIAGALVVTGARAGSAAGGALIGNLLVFAGVLAWGVYTVQGKRLATDVPGVVATAASAGSAAMLIAPLALLEVAFGRVPDVNGGMVLGILYLGVLASAAAYGLWNVSLRYVDASVAGSFINLVPVIGVILAIAVGEAMTAGQWAGAAIVAGGVWLTERSRRATAVANAQ
ncbi:MAG TPA: DMT family transporter [Actinomycetota bacterium]|nr:DMT family transporter [Actinomycetota bacterium]